MVNYMHIPSIFYYIIAFFRTVLLSYSEGYRPNGWGDHVLSDKINTIKTITFGPVVPAIIV